MGREAGAILFVAGPRWRLLSPGGVRKILGVLWIVITRQARDGILERVAFLLIGLAAEFAQCAGFRGPSREGGRRHLGHISQGDISFVRVFHPPLRPGTCFPRRLRLGAGRRQRAPDLRAAAGNRYAVSEDGRNSGHAWARRRKSGRHGRQANNSLQCRVHVTLVFLVLQPISDRWRHDVICGAPRAEQFTNKHASAENGRQKKRNAIRKENETFEPVYAGIFFFARTSASY